ncbi:hypothetical protein GCM10022226_37270 [Sphaerisporangium flaviroseum]|uniref:Lrp/AsnC family transcriptional regulator n=1 Tax=Sphaerisporangium flaviroseum TaxID=509199 RepID=A0ABP7I9S8_9ACTN
MTGSEHVTEAQMFDEVDLALTDALQLNPRVSWTTLARALELSPITLARRWQALVDARSAWTSVTLGGSSFRGAIVEVACAPGTVAKVASTFAELPNVITVNVTIGEYDIVALVVAPTLGAISSVLLSGLPITPEVTRVRSHVFSRVFGGPQWRIGVLNRTQSDQVRSELGPPPKEFRPFSAADRELFLALGTDGRLSYTDLAEELRTSPQVVKRRLDRLQRRGEIAFRCDVARPLASWHSARPSRPVRGCTGGPTSTGRGYASTTPWQPGNAAPQTSSRNWTSPPPTSARSRAQFPPTTVVGGGRRGGVRFGGRGI